ncbi:hypothetical protein [Pelomicrobium sp. G1]|jgi:hypothetical protein|uniref:hypothetical protein n=1 Tax=unclassified Pelomicrobium TaxID=2815318 RepID=UPI003F7774A8
MSTKRSRNAASFAYAAALLGATLATAPVLAADRHQGRTAEPVPQERCITWLEREMQITDGYDGYAMSQIPLCPAESGKGAAKRGVEGREGFPPAASREQERCITRFERDIQITDGVDGYALSRLPLC